MATRPIGVIMNGVTGRMGLNQHLVRSILAIREQGGVALPNGDRLMPDPILVGRDEAKLRTIADEHGLIRVSTDLDACLANPADPIYFDVTVTGLRVDHVRRAIGARKHVYCEKPLAATTGEALELARLAGDRGVKHGIVQDKLFLPGIRKLKQLVEDGFFGRILGVRGEFGYWVFEDQSAQRPSWNYRTADGGGIILDMFAHWRYLLDHTFGPVSAVQCTGARLIPERMDEQGRRYAATADDAAFATFKLDGPAGEILAQFNSSWATRVYRDDLLQIQVDGTLASAVATLRGCKIQRRADTPRAVWNPDVPSATDYYASWQDVADDGPFDNAFKVQWERFLLHVATGAPFPHDFFEGAKGVQLAELALESWREGRWVDVPDLAPGHAAPAGGDAALGGRRRVPAGEIRLPLADGSLKPYTMREPVAWPAPVLPIRCRVAYAAAHVVCDPLRDAAVDWDASLAYRRHLWSLGLGVAEAMDTAQRGMGLDWPAARELIRRSLAAARATGGAIVCGAGTDQLAPADGVTLADVERAYAEQVGYVEGQGGRVVVMASRALARVARGPDDYARVYGTVLRQASRPVILHWLGDMFDPRLTGYWGARHVDKAMEACLAIICEHRAKIDGIKISLLDAEREVALRRQLPGGVRMYTGDDFNYPQLILGDTRGHSDALLGIFDAIAPAASAALQALDRDDPAAYRAALEPTMPLARRIFESPTHVYKTGIVFLAYLNGHQSHFRMLGGAESWRSVPHLAEVFRLADAAGLLVDPDRAVERMRRVLALAGVE